MNMGVLASMTVERAGVIVVITGSQRRCGSVIDRGPDGRGRREEGQSTGQDGHRAGVGADKNRQDASGGGRARLGMGTVMDVVYVLTVVAFGPLVAPVRVPVTSSRCAG
jgi:hypothetical protein